ncbi:molybdate ABC transporter substrate-binding protein [Salinicoccus siamensis]|uniref:Molybdate ABC transporter substrate-binding protein n=1 Tax=Salinicoccus siamensis TaxID=381830 RepID=A0ABV5Z1S5_9STAP
MGRRFFVLIIMIVILSAACSGGEKSQTTLTISVAASLSAPMEELEKLYGNQHPDVEISFNFGGSGTLQQQISKGAPADLFISAASDKFQLLTDEGKIDEQNKTVLLGNSLVLVVPAEGEEVSISSLDQVGRISIGTPDSVPAGRYAEEALRSMDILKDVENNIVYAKDVKQVLSYVETGNVAAGIVYRTDALVSDEVEIVHEFPAVSHTTIEYPAGVLKEAPNYEAAVEFYEFLQTDAALKVFESYGFTIK